MTPTSPAVNQTAQGFKVRNRRKRAGGSQPQSQQGEGMGVLGAAVPLPYFTLPLVMTGQLNRLRTSRVCSRTGRFFLRKASDACLRGIEPVSGTVPIYLCCTGRGGSGQDPPSQLLLVALALFQLCPTRLLMGCLQAGLRQPGRQ